MLMTFLKTACALHYLIERCSLLEIVLTAGTNIYNLLYYTRNFGVIYC